MTPIEILYLLVLAFVKTYKWVELQVLTLFQDNLDQMCRKQMEKLGVIFHSKDKPMRKLTQEEERKILSDCKYDHLLHLKASKFFFVRVANQFSMGLWEGFLNEEFEFTQSLDDLWELVFRAFDSNLIDLFYNPWNRFLLWLELKAFNLQTPKRVWEMTSKHYNLGNTLFELTLDPWMQYSCAYWAKADNLNDAQIDKMDLIARKLDLKPGMRVLEIGCGWGGLCKYLATNYGVSCVGITISKEGATYAKKMCEGLDVNIRLQDYREVNEEFDRIVSIEMFEHVGHWNHREYFKMVHSCLKEQGIFLLQTNGLNHKNVPCVDLYLQRYLLQNLSFPYVQDITKNIEDLFIIEDWHNFGQDYSKTWKSILDNVIKNGPQIRSKYGKNMYQMWVWWFGLPIGVYRARKYQCWQLVLSKNGLQREYRAAR